MKNLLLSLCLLLVSQSASAGVVEQRQFAEEIMEAQGLPQQVVELQVRLAKAAIGEFKDLGFDADQQKLAIDTRKVVLEELSKKIDWKLIKGDIVEIYTREYSEAELRQIRDFLLSPAGKKYSEKHPLIKNSIYDVSREKMLAAMPGILIDVSKRMVKEYKK